MSISKTLFGKNGEGKDVFKYTMTNKRGASVSVLTFGGTLHSIIVPDKNGKMADVCLGFDAMDTYMIKNGSIGAFIGRYGNRIDAGKFTLNGMDYQLNVNAAPNHLHGGTVGYQIRLMEAEAMEGEYGDQVIMSLYSPDGEENYPGGLHIKVTYTFDENCNLGLYYEATAEAKTILNLTNHCYFNLAGQDSGKIYGQTMQIFADCVTEVNKNMIPTGRYLPVCGTPLDFRTPRALGETLKMAETCTAMVLGTGHDHNYVLSNGFGMGLCAVAKDPASGRVMEVITDQPAVQLYSGNHLNITGKGGRHYGAHDGFCLETQHFPDSPNHAHFPTTALDKGETFRSATIYTFTAEK